MLDRKERMQSDALGLGQDAMLARFLHAVGAGSGSPSVEVVVFSDNALLKRFHGFEELAFNADSKTAEGLRLTLVMTNFAVYLFPEMVKVQSKRFLVCNVHRRFALQVCCLLHLRLSIYTNPFVARTGRVSGVRAVPNGDQRGRRRLRNACVRSCLVPLQFPQWQCRHGGVHDPLSNQG